MTEATQTLREEVQHELPAWNVTVKPDAIWPFWEDDFTKYSRLTVRNDTHICMEIIDNEAAKLALPKGYGKRTRVNRLISNVPFVFVTPLPICAPFEPFALTA